MVTAFSFRVGLVTFGLSARSDIVTVALFGSLGASDVCGTNASDCLKGGSHLGLDCRAFV